jgi:serine/threonine protein kinase
MQGYTLKIAQNKIVGSGSFGVVFIATIAETGETVAVKQVLQDPRFKNRELYIMKQLRHPNIVGLKHYFYRSGDKADEVYLNLVLEYVPITVASFVKSYVKAKKLPPLVVVKVSETCQKQVFAIELRLIVHLLFVHYNQCNRFLICRLLCIKFSVPWHTCTQSA